MNKDFPISLLPKIHHFIKGYAEMPLVKIIRGEYPDDKMFIFENLNSEYLFSPYSSGVLNTYSRKIYWETKRGCNSKCGFCEWGNAQTGTIEINPDSIEKDIEIFSQSNIDVINILDATFNIGNNYLNILKKLISKTSAKITLQARFEYLKPEFIKFCAIHKERLHLEFGLQTIHKNEMKVIGRINNLKSIIVNLQHLNQHNIDYEVSVIYAIPEQTIHTFIDTLEFLRINGCNSIMAYPLQIPVNSWLQKNKQEYQVTLKSDKYYVKSVNSSISFNEEARFDMDCIAFSLLHEDKVFEIDSEQLRKVEGTHYQYVLPDEYIRQNKSLLDIPVSSSFLRFENYRKTLKSQNDDSISFLKGSFHVETRGLLDYAIGLQPFVNPWSNGNGQEPSKTYYKMVIGKSGFVYFFRELSAPAS